MNPIQIPWKTHYYYRNRLKSRDRAIYDRIFDGLQNWRPEIPMPAFCNIEEAYRVYTMVIRDCPLFFHVDVGIRMMEGPNPKLFPKYRLTTQQYAQQHRLVCDFVRKSVQQMKGARRTYDKVRSIHNSMARHVIYFGIEEDDSHNVVGAILKRKAVCESIAKAFKLICDANCIPCIVIFGRSTSTDGVQYGTVSENSKDDNHAWNMVKIGESWYNIDVTFDIGAAGFEDKTQIRYDYFCRSDQVFFVNHIPSGRNLPQALKDHSYYKSIGCYVKDVAGLRQLLRNKLQSSSMWINFEYDKTRINMDIIRAVALEEITWEQCSSFNTTVNDKIGVATIHLNK